MNQIDSYFKKTVNYKHADHLLRLKVSQELFSSLEIDRGTQRLLRSLIFEKINTYNKILDLGCGYGPIGIAMKKVRPTTEVHMVDTDALALLFTKENAQLNGFEDISVYGSLGYDQVVERDFDIIVSNIPAKVGDKAIEHILKDARNYLVEGGKVIVVVIDAIADFVHQQLDGDKSIVVTYHRSWSGHHVYHYQFDANQSDSTYPQLAFERGVCFRGLQEFINKKGAYFFDVSYNLSEFDQLSHKTKLLIRMLNRVLEPVKSALCFQVGQGHVPFFVASHFGIRTIELTDCDLLALSTTQHNLAKYHIATAVSHSVLPQGEKNHDIAVGIIPEKQSQEVYKVFLSSLKASLRTNGKAILVSSSTTVNRMQEMLKEDFEILNREKEKGNSALILRKK